MPDASRFGRLKIAPDGRVRLEREMFPQWIERGLIVWKTPGAFIDIGTPESYAEVERYLDIHG